MIIVKIRNSVWSFLWKQNRRRPRLSWQLSRNFLTYRSLRDMVSLLRSCFLVLYKWFKSQTTSGFTTKLLNILLNDFYGLQHWFNSDYGKHHCGDQPKINLRGADFQPLEPQSWHEKTRIIPINTNKLPENYDTNTKYLFFSIIGDIFLSLHDVLDGISIL